MLSRTHGQTATPTTVGKEIANFVRWDYVINFRPNRTSVHNLLSFSEG